MTGAQPSRLLRCSKRLSKQARTLAYRSASEDACVPIGKRGRLRTDRQARTLAYWSHFALDAGPTLSVSGVETVNRLPVLMNQRTNLSDVQIRYGVHRSFG